MDTFQQSTPNPELVTLSYFLIPDLDGLVGARHVVYED